MSIMQIEFDTKVIHNDFLIDSKGVYDILEIIIKYIHGINMIFYVEINLKYKTEIT